MHSRSDNPRIMNSSTKGHISSITPFVFKNHFPSLRLWAFLIVACSCFSFVIALPTASDETSFLHKRGAVLNPGNDLEKRDPAGLRWGPEYVGNLKLSLTNPHEGYAGPKFPWASHVNFHVDKKGPAPRYTYVPVVNLHIVKYTPTGKVCLYVWDSETGTTVFDSCFDDFGTAVAEGITAAKNFVDALLKAADFVAAVAIIAALGVALAAAIASLGAVAVA